MYDRHVLEDAIHAMPWAQVQMLESLSMDDIARLTVPPQEAGRPTPLLDRLRAAAICGICGNRTRDCYCVEVAQELWQAEEYDEYIAAIIDHDATLDCSTCGERLDEDRYCLNCD